MVGRTASVVIPAHNEATVLARTLMALQRGAEPGELDVVVVANGCTDATTAVARRHGVRVVETPVAGKSHALRLGDEVAATFPRIYLDADVELPIESVRALVKTLGTPGVLATAPAPEHDLSSVSPLVRRAHKVHDLMMKDRRGLAGAGAYCLTEAGHSRVAPFPDVISDDGYVHRSFAAGERVVTPAASSVVRDAASFTATVRRRVRVRQGNRQLDVLGVPMGDERLHVGAVVALLRSRWIGMVDATFYLGVLGTERLLARWRDLRGAAPSWGRDMTSR